MTTEYQLATYRIAELEAVLRECIDALDDRRIGTYHMDDPDLYRKIWAASANAKAVLHSPIATED